MTESLIDWDKDLPADPKEEYEALVRSLNWTDGFGLLFVRCSPAEGEKLIQKVRQDIPQKNVEVLRLEQPIDNLYEMVDGLPNKDQINILFITGIEKSFVDYIKPGYGGQGEYYKLDSVPRVLGHLNLQRERFRDNFNICFVFILPLFGLKYFIRRAPDFFDWRSGVFEFPTDREIVESEARRIIFEGDYEKYLSLTPQERNQKIVEIEQLLKEDNQIPSNSADLLFELGNLLLAAKEYQAAIASYDQALQLNPNKDEAWYNRGNALDDLGRYEAAIASYDQALKLKPNKDEAWYNRGNALFQLGRYEEAIASFDQALKLKPNDDEAWNNRGNALGNLGRYEEAIASFDQALKLNQNYDEAWYNRGNALDNLGRYEEAIASYDQALKLNPNDDEAWYNKACCYALQGDIVRSIENLQKAINLNLKLREYAKTDSDFDIIRQEKQFKVLIEELEDGLNYQDTKEIDEQEWLQAAANNPVFDFLNDPEEDIYTLADGKPFND
ncbi:MAG: tetratricopeptide repeat protein [Phormidium sp.]